MGRANDKKGMSKYIGFRLDSALREGLRRFAARMGESESTVVRVILRDRLRREGLLR